MHWSFIEESEKSGEKIPTYPMIIHIEKIEYKHRNNHSTFIKINSLQ